MLDTHTFAELFRANYPKLVEFARGLVDSNAIAEELVQDVFTSIWIARGTWNPVGGEKPYLYAAVRNRAIRHVRHMAVLRRSAPELTAPEVNPAMGERSSSADDQMEMDALRTAIDAVISDLPEGRRTALTLRLRHDMSYADIATVMGISEQTVKSQISRARDVLRERLRNFL